MLRLSRCELPSMDTVYLALSAMLAVAGLLTIALAHMWRESGNMVLQMLRPVAKLDMLTALGASYLLGTPLSIFAWLAPSTKLFPLKCLAAYLLILAVFTLAAGTSVWIFSLRELDNCGRIWKTTEPAIQRSLQDAYSCCGYCTSRGGMMTDQGFCSDLEFALSQPGCMMSVTSRADPYINAAFTCVYACEALVISLALAAACMISERKVEERFRLIDLKRGGGGFV